MLNKAQFVWLHKGGGAGNLLWDVSWRKTKRKEQKLWDELENHVQGSNSFLPPCAGLPISICFCLASLLTPSSLPLSGSYLCWEKSLPTLHGLGLASKSAVKEQGPGSHTVMSEPCREQLVEGSSPGRWSSRHEGP